MKAALWFRIKLEGPSPAIRRLGGIFLLFISAIYLFMYSRYSIVYNLDGTINEIIKRSPDYSILSGLLITGAALLGIGNVTDIWKTGNNISDHEPKYNRPNDPNNEVSG